MGRDIELRCRCGEIHGWLRDASPESVNRIVCYCDDCQAFLHHIERADLLDGHGGSDIVQVAPATLEYDRGRDRITGVRLGPKGLLRWYASCCKTPLGNSLTPSIPFVGLTQEIFGNAPRDELFGPPRAAILGKFAIGEPPAGSKGVNLALMGRTLRLILGWKLRAKAWPHPFFERGSKIPTPPLKTLTAAERDALRPLCGPRAA